MLYYFFDVLGEVLGILIYQFGKHLDETILQLSVRLDLLLGRHRLRGHLQVEAQAERLSDLLGKLLVHNKNKFYIFIF